MSRRRRAAFTHVLQLGALGAALIAAFLAMLAVFSLRGNGRSEDSDVPKTAAAPHGCE